MIIYLNEFYRMIKRL